MSGLGERLGFAACVCNGGSSRRDPGPEHAAAWDQDLATAMLREGVAVHEERVTETLLADLTRPD